MNVITPFPTEIGIEIAIRIIICIARSYYLVEPITNGVFAINFFTCARAIPSQFMGAV